MGIKAQYHVYPEAENLRTSYDQGREARQAELHEINPYNEETDEHRHWREGWLDADMTIRIPEEEARRADRNETLRKVAMLGFLVWATTHFPGHFLVWLLTFQWI